MPSHASGTTDESSGRFGRILGRLTKSSAQLQADDLHHASVRRGATPIAELVPRQRATVCGEVRTGAVVGIIPGVKLRVEGRVTDLRGGPTIYNPAYEILPHHG